MILLVFITSQCLFHRKHRAWLVFSDSISLALSPSVLGVYYCLRFQEWPLYRLPIIQHFLHLFDMDV